ncbi:GDP-fucose synthetase [Candidatus Magnetomorum sp. HK-1]|nr:GDP-fucose synthetase [Candidatus Magnetomorum sp. HK-1]
MEKSARIFIAGHEGMVGSALYRTLLNNSYVNIITKKRKKLDLTNYQNVELFFKKFKPEYVLLAAAKVGGIYANDNYSADFIYENLQIQNNIIHNSYKYGVKKLLFLGSSCIYPKYCKQPMKEEYLLTGTLEPTNEAYAIAKIAGLKMCQYYYKQYNSNFIAVMPTNLYGPGDNFDLEKSHVIPALIRKLHEGKSSKKNIVTIWGSGKPRREFLFVDDMAEASLFIMNKINAADLNNNNLSHINIGTGFDITIRELVDVINSIIKYQGEIVYDSSKPDGVDRKLLDVTALSNLGWVAQTSLKIGIEKTYEWYLNADFVRGVTT